MDEPRRTTADPIMRHCRFLLRAATTKNLRSRITKWTKAAACYIVGFQIVILICFGWCTSLGRDVAEWFLLHGPQAASAADVWRDPNSNEEPQRSDAGLDHSAVGHTGEGAGAPESRRPSPLLLPPDYVHLEYGPTAYHVFREELAKAPPANIRTDFDVFFAAAAAREAGRGWGIESDPTPATSPETSVPPCRDPEVGRRRCREICTDAGYPQALTTALEAVYGAETAFGTNIAPGDGGKANGHLQQHEGNWGRGCEFLGVGSDPNWGYPAATMDLEKTLHVAAANLYRDAADHIDAGVTGELIRRFRLPFDPYRPSNDAYLMRAINALASGASRPLVQQQEQAR